MKYTHGKKLGNTFSIMRVNFGLNVSYILNMFKQNRSFIQNLKYPTLLRHENENDEYPANTVAVSGHLGYRSSVSDFRTLLIFPAINSFYEV